MHRTHSSLTHQQAGPVAKSHWHSIVAHRARSHHVAARAGQKQAGSEPCDISDPSCDLPDPEAKFRRFGRFFGGGYKLTADWLQDVPRVRVRTSTQRQHDELLELAVLNERLAGNVEPWQARQRLARPRVTTWLLS